MEPQKLRQALGKGFYLDNLREIVSLCRIMALDAKSPTPFFVIEGILSGIVADWEDK